MSGKECLRSYLTCSYMFLIKYLDKDTAARAACVYPSADMVYRRDCMYTYIQGRNPLFCHVLFPKRCRFVNGEQAAINTVMAARSTLLVAKILWRLPGRIWGCFKPRTSSTPAVATKPASAPGITKPNGSPSIPNWLLHAGFVGSVTAMLCFPAAATAVIAAIAAAPAVLTSGPAYKARASIALADQVLAVFPILHRFCTAPPSQAAGSTGSVQHGSSYPYGTSFNLPFGHIGRGATDSLIMANTKLYLMDLFVWKTVYDEDFVAQGYILDKDKVAKGEVSFEIFGVR